MVSMVTWIIDVGVAVLRQKKREGPFSFSPVSLLSAGSEQAVGVKE